MHLSLVEPLYRETGSSEFAQISFDGTNAMQEAEYFAGPYLSVRYFHQLKVYIFRFYFPIASFSYAPCFGATIVPGDR